MAIRLRKAGISPGGIAFAGRVACGGGRERAILPDGELVATECESAAGQDDHLRTRLALPEQFTGRPACKASAFCGVALGPDFCRVKKLQRLAIELALAPDGGEVLVQRGNGGFGPAGRVGHLRVLEVEIVLQHEIVVAPESARTSFIAARAAARSPSARSRSARSRCRSTRISGGSWTVPELGSFAGGG